MFNILKFLQLTSCESLACPIFVIMGINTGISSIKEFMGKRRRQMIQLHTLYESLKLRIIAINHKPIISSNTINGLSMTLLGEYRFLWIIT